MNDYDNFFINHFEHNHHVSSKDRIYYNFLKSHLSGMERYVNSISIIIQGPLNERSINTIPEYLKYGEVVVSCWDNDKINLLDKYKNKIKIIVNKYSQALNHKKKPGSQAPWVFQNITTLNGIKESSGYLCIKTRSDESYPVLDKLIDILKHNRDTKNPETGVYYDYKIVTSNIYFRYDCQNKFHPSDHIIAGTRSRMLSAFELSNRYCLKTLPRFPEQLICKAIINSYKDPITKKHDQATEEKSIELMKKHFDIIRISRLPNHIWTSSYRKYSALKSEEDWCHNIKYIDLRKS